MDGFVYNLCSFDIYNFLIDLKINQPYGKISSIPHWKREKDVNYRLLDLECWFVFEGLGTMQIQGKSFTLEPGFFVLMRPGIIYEAQQSEENPLGIQFIHFDAERSWFDTHLQSPVVLSHVPLIQNTMAHIQELWDQHQFAVAQQWLWAMLFDIDRHQHSTPPQGSMSKLQACFRWIRDQKVVPDVQSCARFCCVSLAHFSRNFKLNVGMTPQQFLITERIRRAQILLRESPLSIGQIAEQCGYGDIYFFSRQFKQESGMTPSTYRHAKIVFRAQD